MAEQAFTFLGTRPYVRQDGATSTVLVWKGTCRTCGGGFTFETSARSTKRTDLHKHCPLCKAGRRA